MKAQTLTPSTLDWPSTPSAVARGLVAQARGLEVLARLANRLAVALIPAVAIVVAASVAIVTPGAAAWLQALLWVSGFLFYAMGFEAERGFAIALFLALGATVQASAWASAQHALELGVAGATVVAAAVAFGLFRRF